jgi:hypothetical protein
MKKRKFIYLSNKDFDGTVYQTQVIDWLHLYQKHSLNFDLYQGFHYRDAVRISFIKNQLHKIKSATKLYKGFFFIFPSKSIFVYLNTFIFYLKLFKYFFKYQEILIFSRGMIGKEIDLLKKISPVKLIFFYDGRAASGEENKYSAIKQGDFSARKYNIIAHVFYTEYKTLIAADKIFVVSNILKNYFIANFKIREDKFVLYPCLSDAYKFFCDETMRDTVRRELNISKQTKVFLYAGGISAGWHISTDLFRFFDLVNLKGEDIRFLFLTKDYTEINNLLDQFPRLKDNLISKSVENDQMVKYLNAADYGILFREDTIMNNVASPTKFAEYMLCGLPTLISEGVGDYTEFCRSNKVGFIVDKTVFSDLTTFDVDSFLKLTFNRKYISDIGKARLSKESIVETLISELNS